MRLRLVLGSIPLCLLVAGCGANNAGTSGASSAKTARLAKGTEVSLVLLRQIEAGSSREGLLVPFMVAEDVKDADGSVLVPKGAIAEGEVRHEQPLLGQLVDVAAQFLVGRVLQRTERLDLVVAPARHLFGRATAQHRYDVTDPESLLETSDRGQDLLRDCQRIGDALELGQTVLEIQTRGRLEQVQELARRLASVPRSELPTTLNALRRDTDAVDLTVYGPNNQILAITSIDPEPGSPRCRPVASSMRVR